MAFVSYVDEVTRDMEQAEKDALNEIGFIVKDGARLLSAVDTGRLRQSIEKYLTLKDHSVTIGTDVVYAEFIEFGTRYMSEQPFLTPAVLDNLDNMKRIIEDYYERINNES